MRASLVGLIAFTVACGPSTKDPGEDVARAKLSIDPPTADLLIKNGTAPTQGYTATLTFPDGSKRDVTSEATFSIDPSFGTFLASTLTPGGAGKTQVYANWTDKTSAGQVIIRVENSRVDPNLPANVADLFNGADDPLRAPNVVYPPVDTVMPRNLGDFEVHWTDSSNNDVWEVSLKTEFADVRAYVKGGNGSGGGPNPSWMAFLASEWTAAVNNEHSVQFQVRGVQSTNPVSVGSTAPRLIVLSNEPMLGGLYYWAATAANGPYGIFRHDMNKPGQPAEQYMTTAQTNGRCVACHVLSRDGTKMAITYDGGNGAASMVDVAMQAAQPAVANWNFGTFTADGSKFLSVYAGTLTVRNYADQAAVATMPAAGWVTQPDMSPDGTRLVYVHPNPSPGADWSFIGGQIFVRTFDSSTNSFGPEQQLVADGANNYYPSFSPDGKWILFNKAAGNGNAYNNGNASLWVIPSDGSGPAVELAKANAALGLTNSWGRWAPFAQTVGQDQIYWVTVSSMRDFGVRLVGTRRPQLWMTPFYPGRASAAMDPSAASFRLPFQNIESNNHIAQWTEQVVTTL